MPIYRVNNGINYITSIIWASPYSLIFGCDGGMLYAISFSNDFIRPKVMYIKYINRISNEGNQIIDCCSSPVYL